MTRSVDELLAQAHAVSPDVAAGLVDLLRRFQGERLRISRESLDRAERQAAAVRLLGQGLARAVIVDRLAHARGVSRRTARRDLAVWA